MILRPSGVTPEVKGRGQERPMTDVAGTTIDLTAGTRGMGLMAGTMLAGMGAHMAIVARHPMEGPPVAAVDGRKALMGKAVKGQADTSPVVTTRGVIAERVLKGRGLSHISH
jgi:hypothetical protein